ncbi:holin family protein [Turicibacter sanguinis]|uniref:phage holin family protein n=1 Tax=Turicibacter sanguinis TaxID=154288 RepID=UPI0018A95685|nr:phage holin family protein [Turicibacter sanguinis]MDB8553513.1 phage holin family protein [Turicibacter sanguinis]
MRIYSERMNNVAAFVGTAFTWLFGAWDLALAALITLMVLDYLTGVTRSVMNGDGVNSEKGFKGIFKKVTILYMVILAVVIDRLIGEGWIFRTLICFWYAANEGISILENAAAIGLPIPEQLFNALEQLKQGNKKAIKEEK